MSTLPPHGGDPTPPTLIPHPLPGDGPAHPRGGQPANPFDAELVRQAEAEAEHRRRVDAWGADVVAPYRVVAARWRPTWDEAVAALAACLSGGSGPGGADALERPFAAVAHRIRELEAVRAAGASWYAAGRTGLVRVQELTPALYAWVQGGRSWPLAERFLHPAVDPRMYPPTAVGALGLIVCTLTEPATLPGYVSARLTGIGPAVAEWVAFVRDILPPPADGSTADEFSGGIALPSGARSDQVRPLLYHIGGVRSKELFAAVDRRFAVPEPDSSPAEPPAPPPQEVEPEDLAFGQQMADYERRLDERYRVPGGEYARLADDMRVVRSGSFTTERVVPAMGYGIDMAAVERSVREFWERALELGDGPDHISPREPTSLSTMADVRNALGDLIRWADGCARALARAANPPPPSPGRRPGRKRGRPPAAEKEPLEVARVVKLYEDWKASEQTLPEFARKRGIPLKEAVRLTDRGEYHSRKRARE